MRPLDPITQPMIFSLCYLETRVVPITEMLLETRTQNSTQQLGGLIIQLARVLVFHLLDPVPLQLMKSNINSLKLFNSR